MSNALNSQGVKFQRGNGGSPEVFSDVGEVVSFDGPGGGASIIDVTHLQSLAREKRLGLADEGQFTLGLNMVPSDTQQTGLRNDRLNRLQRNFKLLLTDAGPTTASFAAFVLNYKVSGKVDDKIALEITLEITGAVTWA